MQLSSGVKLLKSGFNNLLKAHGVHEIFGHQAMTSNSNLHKASHLSSLSQINDFSVERPFELLRMHEPFPRSSKS